MNAVRAVWAFLLDLIIGDDAKIAGAMVLAVGTVAAALATDVVPVGVAMVGGAVLVLGAFALALLIDIRG